MIGVILAAGKGSRLGAQTSTMPKSLLPLNGSGTILDYNIRMLDRIGIKKILIVVGFNAEKIQEHVSLLNHVQTVVNPFWNVCNVLGSLYMALPHITEEFLFLHADTLVDIDVWEKLRDHRGDVVFPYQSKQCGDEEMKVRLSSDGHLLEVSKTMPHDSADGEFLGIAKFSKLTIPLLTTVSSKLFSTGRLDYYMEAAVQHFIEHQLCDVQAFDIGKSKFIEIDFEEDYRQAQKIFIE